MKTTSDFCVIGGGIAGLTVARKLAASGSVIILDASRFGRGASRAAGGMLAPFIEARLDEDSVVRFGFECLNYYPGFVQELEQETGQHLDYRSEGTLIVGLDRDDLEHLKHLYSEQRKLGLPVELLSGYDCRQLEPGLATGVPGGIFSPQDHQIDNRLLLSALQISLASQPNVTMIEEGAEGSFQFENGRPASYDTGEHSISAGHYVIATGAWGGLLRGILPETPPPVRPVKGQIIRLDQSAMPVVNHIVRSPEMYLAPKSDGTLVLGASVEDRGFDRQITAGAILELLRAAWECLPGVYELPIIETMVGFRPATVDHTPLIGGTGIDGVSLAMGYYRHGILFAPLAAEILARHILDGTENNWLASFTPERFHGTYHQRQAD